MTTNVRKHARRLLAAQREIDGQRRAAYPTFSMFSEDSRPSWWAAGTARPEWGEIIGVYENRSGTATGAIVVTEEGLAVLGHDGAPVEWVRYADVDRWDRLSKDPVSKSLVVWTKNGERVELPFVARAGDAFSFVQFLGSAMREHRKR